MDRRQPQLAILIDFPDFNLRMARQLKKRRIPVVYFVSPQVWAWRKRRVQKLKERIAKMIVIFDFEEEIYKQAGVPVEYVGHPLVDMVRPHLTRQEFFAKVGLDASVQTVALLPGSRQKEVTANLPVMLDAATRLTLNRKLQFVVAVAPTIDSRWLETHPPGVLRGPGHGPHGCSRHLRRDATLGACGGGERNGHAGGGHP